MAIGTPTFGSVSTSNGGSTTPGIPTHAAGDVFVLFHYARNGLELPNPAPSGGSLTWTERLKVENASGVSSLSIWTAIASSGSETAPTVTAGTNANLCVIGAWSGVDNTTPVDVMGTGAWNASTTTTHVAPSVSTTTADCGLVYFGGCQDDTAWSSFTSPLTEYVDATTTDGNDGSIGIAFGIQTSSGASGDKTGTLAVAEFGGCVLFALRPAASGTQYQQAVSGSVTGAGSLIKRTKDRVTGSVTPSGTVKKAIKDRLVGSITAAGSLLKKTARLIQGAITSSGALSTRKFVSLLLTGTVTITGSLVRKTARILSGIATPTGAVAKRTSISKAGSITAAGDLVKKTARLIQGSITSLGALSTRKFLSVLLTGTITAAGSLARKTARLLQGASTIAGALSRKTSIIKAGSISASSIASKFSNAGVFAGTITAVGQLTTRFFVGINFAGSITASGNITRRAVTRTMSGVIQAAGAVTKKTARLVGGSITIFAFIAKKTSRVLSGVSSAAGSLLEAFRTTKGTAGSITPAGTSSQSHIPGGPAPLSIARTVRGLLTLLGKKQ